jgi:hypothetical protein
MTWRTISVMIKSHWGKRPGPNDAATALLITNLDTLHRHTSNP